MIRRRLRRWQLAGRPRLVRLHAGDTVVVTVPEPLDDRERWQLRLQVEDVFGYQTEVLILDRGADLVVIRDPAAGR